MTQLVSVYVSVAENVSDIETESLFDPFTLLQLDIVIYSVNQYVSEGVWDVWH